LQPVKPKKNKSELIKDILFSWDFADFMDGKTYVKTTLHGMLNNKDFFKINAIIAAILFIILVSIPFAAPSESILSAKLMFLIPLIPAIILFLCIKKLYNNFRKENSGLNPGNVFRNTMKNALESFGIKTVAHLNEKFIQKEYDLNLNYRYGNGQEYYTMALQSIESIKNKNLEHIDQTRYKIFYESAVNNDYYKNNPFYLLRSEYVIITTDINAKIKVELPTMANLYWSEEELKHISPADL
jgi:NTE family protein